MARNAQGLSDTTRKNKIKRLEKHVKKMTFAKEETAQVDGRLKLQTVTRYRGGKEALDSLARLKSV